jgi:hypothetical protein
MATASTPSDRKRSRMAGRPERSSGTALLPGRRQAPGHLPPQVAGHERLGLAVEEVEEVRPVAAGDLERVAEPLRGDQARRDALALGEGVDDHRRPVDEEADVRRRDARLGDDVEHAALEVGGVVSLLAVRMS